MRVYRRGSSGRAVADLDRSDTPRGIDVGDPLAARSPSLGRLI